jgi:hypothetical protein
MGDRGATPHLRGRLEVSRQMLGDGVFGIRGLVGGLDGCKVVIGWGVRGKGVE